MATGSLVRLSPPCTAWGGGDLGASGISKETVREAEVVSLPHRNGWTDFPSSQVPQAHYMLSYSDTGLPVLLFPSSDGMMSSFSTTPERLSPSFPSAFSSSSSVPFPYGSGVVAGRHFPRGSFQENLFCPAPRPPLPIRRHDTVSTGTTIVAVTFKNGVVLGADTRTSAGSYVVNRAARKITPVHDKICVCRSGSAADTQAVTQIVKLYLQQYAQELPRRSTAAERRRHGARQAAETEEEQQQEKKKKKKEEEKEEEKTQAEKRRETAQEEEEGERRKEGSAKTKKSEEDRREEDKKKEREEEDESKEDSEEEKQFLWEDARAEPRVRAAATLFQSLCYEYKDLLSAGLIVAGYDTVEGSQIYSIPLGGAMMPMKCTAGGSGSAFISAFMDSNYREDMEKETAVDFVKKCVAHAISRDGSSGGMIRIVVVMKHGLEEECVEGNQLPVNP